jgi:hypothetical protein
MRRAQWIACALVIISCGLAKAAVELIPFRLEESRSIALVEDKIGHPQPALKVTFSLKGPEAESSIRFGNLKLDEAVDDKGTSLIPEKGAGGDAEKFRDYSNAFFRKFDIEGKRPPAAPQVDVELGLPKRSATKIARLRGSFSLAQQGTIKDIEVSGLKKLAEKKLELPAGAGAEITITIKPEKEIRSIGLAITGDESAVESIEVVGAGGKKVSSGMSSWSLNGGPIHKSLDLMEPLDDSMKLVVKIALNRKITSVPFDLKDIPLP